MTDNQRVSDPAFGVGMSGERTTPRGYRAETGEYIPPQPWVAPRRDPVSMLFIVGMWSCLVAYPLLIITTLAGEVWPVWMWMLPILAPTGIMLIAGIVIWAEERKRPGGRTRGGAR